MYSFLYPTKEYLSQPIDDIDTPYQPIENENENEIEENVEAVLNESFHEYLSVYKESKKSIYCGLERFHDCYDDGLSNKCYIIPYHNFDENLDNPFIQIMFLKNPLYETIDFIEFFLDEDRTKDQIVKKACNLLNDLLEGYCGISNLTSAFFKDNFKGQIIYKQNSYLFFDISSIDISNLFIRIQEMIWFGMADEILNHKKICGFSMYHTIQTFFKNHLYFLQLTDANKTIIYDFPVVCYTGAKTIEQTKFINIFGVSTSNTIYGEDLYMLTDYANSIKNKNHGIVRFAFFTKKMTNDICEYTNPDIKTDTYLCWNDNSPEWYFKNFLQQIPLTYHQIFYTWNTDIPLFSSLGIV